MENDIKTGRGLRMRKKISKLLVKSLNTEPEFKEQSNTEDIELKKQDISTQYEQNLETFKSIFSVPLNSDVKVREFTIRSLNRRAFIIFVSTMVDLEHIKESIMEKLLGNDQRSTKIQDIVSYPMAKTATNIGEITDLISGGVTALFVEGDSECYLFETTKLHGRSIEKSDNEVIVKGAKEAFNENVVDNVALIRKKIKNENLIVESKEITKRSKNSVFLVYEKDLVNDEILQIDKR